MQVAITKGRREDRIAVERDDGTRAETSFPKKGTVPHDAVHWIVERELGLARGFWGLVAQGKDPNEIGQLAKAGGHASAKRAATTDPAIRELVQAERLVECFEAEMWSPDPPDTSALREVAAAACAASHVPAPPLPETAIERVRAALESLRAVWTSAPDGYTLRLGRGARREKDGNEWAR